MSAPWVIFSIALAYVGALFLIASLGDRFFRHGRRNRPRPFIYALSLAVYCTTWTFYGSVGLSARSGLDFLPVYIGPVLLLVLGWPLLGKVVKISKRHNITSIADFISARYGKHRMLGALVALVAIIGVVPYISLQLKAVSISIETLIPQIAGRPGIDMALIVAIAMAGFAILFGTRHIDATEHQDGLILAVAVESIVKLVAFLAVGVFVVFWQIGGLAALKEQLTTNPAVTSLFLGPPNWTRWVTISLLSLFAFLLLPRQFHVAVVENAHPGDVRKAAFIFPLYLVAINLFVVPIAAAGLTTFGTLVDADTYVLGLPLAAGHGEIAILVFIGGLSAATAMIIIETVALSIMACNNLVVPLLLSRRAAAMPSADMGRVLIIIRRLAIAAILFLAYSYYAMAGASKALAQTGLISFAAVAQFAPAFIGGLLWRRATARGAIAGIVAGFIAWAYTLLLPSFADSGWMSAAILQEGPFGIDWLRPRALFGLAADPLTHGAVWSLGLNVAAWIGVSLFTRPTPAERMQAAAFITHDDDIGGDAAHVPHGTLRIGELQRAVARYLGDKRTARAFADFARRQRRGLDANADADIDLLRHAEHLLASAVGAASSRLILALLLERNAPASRNTLQLLDDASSAIQYNRDLLQSAIDHMRQGLGVYDRHHNLICWNRRFRQLLHLPADMGSIGEPFGDVLRHVLSRALGRQPTERELQRRLSAVLGARKNVLVHFANSDTVLEVRASKLPDGGHVVTFSDITDRVKSEQALQKANEMLERRVEERTAELLRLNHELARAKARAEQANLDKTRFIAAASHDILQPLNAARLFTSSLVERTTTKPEGRLARQVDAALESVEEILSALLEISRIDAGAMKPEITAFPVMDVLAPLAREFAAPAAEKGLRLRVVPSSLWVRSDRRLLRRLLQNLLSNAIKYTHEGGVLMGCRRQGGQLRVIVMDTGPGIPQDKRAAVFNEFTRLPEHEGAPGLGLGLSIVERITRMLGDTIDLESRPGHGTMFTLRVPLARAGARPSRRAEARPAPPPEAGAAKVLVIDDDATILQGMKTLLGGWGHEVVTAHDAATAQAHMSAGRRFTAIIADYHLGGNIDGISLIRALRGAAGGELPAILITANSGPGLRKRASRERIILLNKPVRPAALRATLNRACQISRPPKRAAAE